MKNPLFIKCALLALIGALLLIPLSMVESTIGERASHRADAIQAIAASSAGEQTIIGPILTIPVVEAYDDEATLTGVGVTWLSGFQFEIKVVAKLPDSAPDRPGQPSVS